MLYRLLLRRGALRAWDTLSRHEIERLPLGDGMRFRYEGDHELAADLRSAEEVRAWLRDLFQRFPRLRFEVEEMVIAGPPWAVRAATRYRAVQDGELLYTGAHFVLMRWGRVTDERVLPDTAALERVMSG